MLTLTPTASTVVKTIAAQNPDQVGTGLRITPAESQPGAQPDFQLTVVPEPEATDQVIESEGARVFLEPSIAVALEEAVLDAEVQEGGTVRFALGTQKAS